MAWLSIRLPKPANAIRIDPMLSIAVADLVKKKFTPESLLLFVDPRMELDIDYLNRVSHQTFESTRTKQNILCSFVVILLFRRYE